MLSVVAGCASAPPQPDGAVLKEIAPTGKLRFGIVFAPQPSTFFVTRLPSGEGRGVTVELANALGRALGVPVEFFLVPNSGEVTEALTAGRIDAAFMPADDERRRGVDSGILAGRVRDGTGARSKRFWLRQTAPKPVLCRGQEGAQTPMYRCHSAGSASS
jgi:hypothetical protein